MKSIIRNFIAKMVAGRADDGIMITLKDPKKVEFQGRMLEDLLMRNGIDPNAIKSEEQLKNILNQIKAAEAQAIRNTDVSGIRNAESAKVFDMQGKEIPKGSQIMGGKEVKNTTGSLMSVPNKKGLAGMEYETDAAIKARLEKGNKDSVQKIIDRKNREDVYGIEDYDTTNMSEIKKEIIRTETKLGNLNPNNPDFRERANVLINKIEELKNKMRDDKADGGRIGLKGGADAATESFSKSAGSTRPGRKDPVGGFNLSGGQGPTFDGATPTTGGGGGGNNNPPPFSTNNTTPDTTFFDNTFKSGLMSNISPSILKRLAKLKEGYKGFKPVIGDEIGLEYLDEDKLRDVLTNFSITQDLENLIKTKKLDPQLKYKKEIGDNTSFDFGINKEGDANIMFKKQFAKGGRAGFFMGSPLPKGLATLRTMLNYMGKKSDVVKKPSDVLKMVNPKSLNAMLNDPKLQGKVNIKEGILASDTVKNFQSKMGEDRVQLVKDMLSAAKNIKKADTSQIKLKNEMIEDMVKKGIDRGIAEEMATTMSRLAEDMAGKFKDTPKLTDEGILELENVLKNMETGGKKKRDLNADGGRIGLKDGMNRRTFLKFLAGFASIPIIGKIIKPLKTVKGVKNVPIIKTGDVPGKPEWFDALVNKVIIEGDDVTKKLATVEREVVHTKKINNTDEVTVYQDLNTDSVRVEFNSPNNMMEEQVDLSYKRTPPDEGAPQASSEFEVTESGFASKPDGPDDYFIDAEPVGGSSIKDLDSDVSALKEYATGQKQTLKEFVESKKRKDKVKKLNEGDLDAQSEYIVNRQGDYVPEPDDFASGGIARMLGE
jgi:hypothetical protein